MQVVMVIHIWTDEEINLLNRFYPHTSTSFVAKKLNLPRYKVKGKIDKLKLHLLPKKERFCNTCWKHLQLKRTYGNRCKDCHNKRKRDLRRTKYVTQEERFNEILRTIRYRSRKSNLGDTDLTLEFIQNLFTKQDGKCFYSGIVMNFERWGSKRKKYSITVDRIDPSKGYTKDNVVLSSWAANVGKSNFSLNEYIRFCAEVTNYYNRQRTLV